MTDKKSTNAFSRKLFADANGYRITVHEVTEATVKFAPQGGGFQHEMKREAFEATFKEISIPPYKAAKFTADWFPENFKVEGYTNGLKWDGWEIPYFTKQEGLKLLEHLPSLKYDKSADAFINTLEDAGPDDLPTLFPAEILLEVSGKEVKVYGIGASSWCWDLAD